MGKPGPVKIDSFLGSMGPIVNASSGNSMDNEDKENFRAARVHVPAGKLHRAAAYVCRKQPCCSVSPVGIMN